MSKNVNVASHYLFDKFKEYYKTANVTSIPDIHTREFGYGGFGVKIATRHLHFKEYSDFNKFLFDTTPFYVSYSVGYYNDPAGRPMENKVFNGADLIMEFDVDDIPTDCKEKHDFWVCSFCDNSGKGSITHCPRCGSGTKQEEWVCYSCMDKVKEKTLKLIEILKGDFGVKDEEIRINYSGSKGYHVHVIGDRYKGLDSKARAEISDYMQLKNLGKEYHGFYKDKKVLLAPRNAIGISGRIVEGLKKFFVECDPELLSVVADIGFRKAKNILTNRLIIIQNLENGILNQFSKEADKSWEKIIDYVLSQQSLEIDRQTTIDLHRLIRVPDTIHGSTGFLAKRINDLDKFDPLADGIIFSDKATEIFVKRAPEFIIKNEKYGPYNNETITVPEYVAVYLLARGAAEWYYPMKK